MIKNSNGKWVSRGWCMKPEEVMFVDKEFTNILSTNDLTFKEKPKEERTTSFLGSKGYLIKSDSGDNIKKLCDYFSELVKGNYFGDYLEACVKIFQKSNGLTQDDNVGPITLAKLKEYGFKE